MTPPSSSARKAQLSHTLGLACLLAVAGGCQPVRLDENLCPRNQPPERTTILLLDTSDPLNEKQRGVFSRMVRELQEPGGPADFRVAPGEALVVYELPQKFDDVEPLVLVCNPGDRPDDWGWQRELTEGKQLALAAWRRFRERVEPLFADRESTAEPSSPILEFLGVIVPRHTPSARVATETRTHLILYSDLLQHSSGLSHYGPYPPADAIPQTTGLRHLRTDLTGVEVSLYRLERSRDARWQTTEHYYWWTRLVDALGGKVIWQESV